LFDQSKLISAETVKELVISDRRPAPVTDIMIPAVALHSYDCLLKGMEVTA